MSNDRKTLLQHMDGVAELTGIPRLARGKPGIRRLRWSPLLLLLLATILLVVVLFIPRLWVGFSLSMFGMIESFAVVLQQIGPLKTKKSDESVDEREELWRTRSNLFGFAGVALVAWIGVVGFGGVVLGMALAGWSLPSTNDPLLTIGFWLVAFALYLLILFITLPTLHASWTMPEIIEHEPEEEDRLSFLKPRRH